MRGLLPPKEVPVVVGLLRVSFARNSTGGTDGMEGLNFRIPHIIVQFDELREDVIEACRPARLSLCGRHIVGSCYCSRCASIRACSAAGWMSLLIDGQKLQDQGIRGGHD